MDIHTPPPPFNMDARPGLHDSVSIEYAKWCKTHASTQEERKQAYQDIYEKLRPKYPSYKEMRCYEKNAN